MAVEGLRFQRPAVFLGVPVDQVIDVGIGQGDKQVSFFNAAHDIGEAAAHWFDGGLGICADEDANAWYGGVRRIAIKAGGDADP